jgi:NAD-dependent DNA ligase
VHRPPEAGLKFEQAVVRKEGGPLAAKDLIVPGTLPDLTREEASSKLDKARELGVAVVDEARLLQVIEY